MKRKTTIVIKIMMVSVLALSLNYLSTAQESDNSSISSMTIEQCYDWSKNNFPFIRQMDIIDKSTEYSIKNASNGNLPQVNINGQISYQSAVTELPIDIPGMNLPILNKDQYKAFVGVYQPLTNFSTIKNQKKIIETNSEIEKQELEVEFQKLKDRINQIYFGILLINEKNEQLKLTQSDIDSTLKIIQAAIDNGTAALIDMQLLEVEKITLGQKIAENNSNQLAFLDMLSTLTGKRIGLNTQIIRPQTQNINSTINRSELQIFSLLNKSIAYQLKQAESIIIPQIGLFGQAGYGRPALNFLSNDFETYYIGGIKMNWNITGLYNLKNTKEKLSLVKEKIATQKETFLLNTDLTYSQQSAEIIKYQGLIESDKEIIIIRQKVLKTAKVQLENGLITTLDYVKYLNDLNKAKQVKLLHETQLLLARQNLKNTTGN